MWQWISAIAVAFFLQASPGWAAAYCGSQVILTAQSNAGRGFLSAYDPTRQTWTPLWEVHPDVELRAFPGHPYAYVIQREDRNRIQVIDRATLKQINEFPVGPNPQDLLAVNAEFAFLTHFALNEVVKIRVPDGKVVQSIRLPDVAPEGGVSGLGSLYLNGTDLLVQVRRLKIEDKTWVTPDYSEIAVVDIATGELKHRIRLKGKNPMGGFAQGYDDRLYVATDIGIESIHKKTYALTEKLVYPAFPFPGRAIGVEIVDLGFGYIPWLLKNGEIGLKAFDPLGDGHGMFIADKQPIQIWLNRESRLLYSTYRNSEKTWLRIQEAVWAPRHVTEIDLPAGDVPTQMVVLP